MLRKLIVGSILMLFLAMPAWAANPGDNPPPTGPWGTDVTNWQVPSGFYDTGELVYKPGTGYIVVATGQPVVWEDLWVKLWIEMEIHYTLSHTNLEVHRVSDYSDITWVINGEWWGNHPTWFFWDGQGGAKDLFSLPFENSVAGANTGTDIPLTWRYRIDGGNWYNFYEMSWLHDWGFQLPSCHHYFDILMVADLVYHQDDGYYFFDPMIVCSPEL